jgi:hypothetical protein
VASIQQQENEVKQELSPEEIARSRSLPNGEAAAAFVAAGIGCLTIGVLTVLETIFGFLHTLLQFYPPAGSITGISTVMVVVWLVTWFILYWLWKSKQVNFTRVVVIVLACILLGVIGIFPPFVHLFA